MSNLKVKPILRPFRQDRNRRMWGGVGMLGVCSLRGSAHIPMSSMIVGVGVARRVEVLPAIFGEAR